MTEEEAELSRLRRENAELRMERDIIKKVSGVLRARVAARYAVIKELRREYPLAVLCRVLEVSGSGFHAWLTRVPSRRARARERLKVAARAAHLRTRQTYGAQRLQKELASDGFVASLGTVKSVRRELGLRCVRAEEALSRSDHRLASSVSGGPEPARTGLQSGVS